MNDYYELWIEERQKGFASVKEAYQRLTEKYPADWRVLFSVANSFCYNECYEEAIPIWLTVLDDLPKPRYTDPYESIAQCYILMGQPGKAAEYYQKELELLREDWNVRFGEEVDTLKEKIRQLKA